MRSVVVVLSASMCAMMPMLRVRAKGYSRISSDLPPRFTACSVPDNCILSGFSGIFSAGLAMLRLSPFQRKPGLGARYVAALYPSPAVVREGLVGLGHLVHVFPALHRSTGAVGSVHDLGHKSLGHRVLATRAAVVDEPAKRERGTTLRPNLDRHL